MSLLTNLVSNIVFQTVISGVLIFILSQTIQEFFLKVVQCYYATLGKIDNKLKFYANIISNPGLFKADITTECSKELRSLSCELSAIYNQIPITSLRNKIKSKELISDSASRLIRLANSLVQGEVTANYDDMKKIRENLGIPEL